MRAYRVAYDGRPFHGFQRQPAVDTVADALLDALADLDVTDGDERVPDDWAAAGRTDAGVSAVAQTVAFEAPEWLTPRAFNSALPGSVRVWASADAPAAFHATHDATRRRYRYHLHAPDADADAAKTAAKALSGEHDFHNLTPDETGTVRDLDVTVRAGDDGGESASGVASEEFLVVDVAAGGFARQLVRRLMSVVAAVATGAAGLDRVDRVLASAPLDGPAGVAPALPEPLVLLDVAYGDSDLAFAVDERARESALAALAERRVDALRSARATGTMLRALSAAGSAEE
ncbi:MAG: tRNA pseudouridine(38-40) synthase TruA [Halolamina sp.]